jgi:hypothetical protein
VVKGFIDHLYTPLGTASNYSPTADLHNTQITTEPAKRFAACCVFLSFFLVAASNSGDSLASALTPFSAGHRLTNEISSEPKSQLLYDWRFTANQFVMSSNPLRITTTYFIQLNSCDNSPYVTSSLTRRLIIFGHGPRRKHSCFIVACMYVCGRYIATTAVYRVTA